MCIHSDRKLSVAVVCSTAEDPWGLWRILFLSFLLVLLRVLFWVVGSREVRRGDDIPFTIAEGANILNVSSMGSWRDLADKFPGNRHSPRELRIDF
jgi:hypothetical protein